MKILVIEDDDHLRRMVTKILCSDGHEVVAAEDGVRGTAAFRRERPDIVVTDIIMPEQEGIETIVTLRREDPRVKIIAMSGGAPMVGGIDFLKMAQLLGADDVIGKPFRARDLLDRVHALGFIPAPADGKLG